MGLEAFETGLYEGITLDKPEIVHGESYQCFIECPNCDYVGEGKLFGESVSDLTAHYLQEHITQSPYESQIVKRLSIEQYALIYQGTEHISEGVLAEDVVRHIIVGEVLVDGNLTREFLCHSMTDLSVDEFVNVIPILLSEAKRQDTRFVLDIPVELYRKHENLIDSLDSEYDELVLAGFPE